jgi:hypothetical protein
MCLRAELLLDSEENNTSPPTVEALTVHRYINLTAWWRCKPVGNIRFGAGSCFQTSVTQLSKISVLFNIS